MTALSPAERTSTTTATPAVAVLLLVAAQPARAGDRPASPPALVIGTRAAGFPLGVLSVPRSGAAEGARFLFVSNEKRRLDAELTSRRDRRIVRLTSGRGDIELSVLTLPEFAASGAGTPVILRAGARRFLVTDPGTAGGTRGPDRQAAAAAATSWAGEQAPGLLPLAAEAQDVVAALRVRTQGTPDLPPGYSVKAPPLDALDFLLASLKRPFDARDLRLNVLPPNEAEAFLKARPARREAERRPLPPAGWAGRVAGGQNEKLGRVSTTRDEDGVEAAVVIGWSHGDVAETLSLRVDEEGVARLSIERTPAGKSAAVLAIETVPGGSGDFWVVPWIVEDPKGQRVPTLVPSAPEAEAQRARSRFLDAATASVWRAGLSAEGARQLLWRWYRILDSEKVRSLVPELSELAELLGWMPPPPFGSGDESAWLGAVRVE